jgi:hypothetical protein
MHSDSSECHKSDVVLLQSRFSKALSLSPQVFMALIKIHPIFPGVIQILPESTSDTVK